MRLPNKCDSMNITGCDQLHQFEINGTGFNHFLYTHQIEIGFSLACFVIFGLILYFGFKNKAKSNKDKTKW